MHSRLVAICYARPMYRVALLVGILGFAACGGSARGPAWPKLTVAETDGGESLAPRKAASFSIEEAEDEVVVEVTPEPAKVKPEIKASETPKGATSTPTTAPDLVITTEEIVIEIEN